LIVAEMTLVQAKIFDLSSLIVQMSSANTTGAAANAGVPVRKLLD
jgi:hypothetical protein